jgi:hypothetical protein
MPADTTLLNAETAGALRIDLCAKCLGDLLHLQHPLSPKWGSHGQSHVSEIF